MAASHNLARLREQTMGSLEDEEAVTVNTRALIDKVLARYSGEWTTLRELLQNAADAQASNVTIRFETLPSATVPLPQTQDASDHVKHTLLHHTIKTLLVSNDGEPFKETDWQRLKRIAEGNPDETKIGAFGVGFYSVFADCESPFVTSGNDTMAFYWKKDSLFTRRSKLPDSQASKLTTFLLDYRNQTTPVPQLLSLCQFLATSLTFVALDSIELWLDDWRILKLTKKMSPGSTIQIPSDVNPKTRDGLMKIVGVEYQTAQIDAQWMNVVGWNRRASPLQGSTTNHLAAQSHPDFGGVSLRNWFGRFTGGSTSNSASRKAQREEDAKQQAIVDDLAGFSIATVFLRISTVNVQTFVGKQLAQELERATKKPPPRSTRIAILTSSLDESSASLSASSGSSSHSGDDIFASVLPTKSGKIFIGFPTAQTTGLLAHISAPSVIPTVERESIDLNARYVRDWNIEMLRVAGIACRIAYTGEMNDLKTRLDRAVISNGRKKVTEDELTAVMPSAIHTYRQYNYSESTPSSKVGQYIEEAFWMCNQKASIDVLSTRGVLPSHQVRVATEHLSFVEGIPVIPDQLMQKANDFLTKLRDYGLLSDITTSDIKKELEAQALSERQVSELVKWACTKVSQQDMDAAVIQTLFDGTVGSVGEAHIATSSSPIIQLGEITTFVNTAKVPADMPTPPQTIPFRFTKGLSPVQLQSLGWEELQIVPWLRWIVESDGRGFGPGQSLTGTPSIASQVLPVVSKSWDGLSQSSKLTVQELLTSRTVIPTKLGLRKPPQAYFASVRLFDDLPTITNLQGVKEKFLAALGVRKTVELNVVFDRLMAKSVNPAAGQDAKWSHVDLIKYLVSVRDDIPAEDIKRLQQTPICPAETRSDDQATQGKLYRLSELFQPNDAIRKLGLPVLQWPDGQYRENNGEGVFLRKLGLQPFPAVPDLVKVLAAAPAGSELQQRTLQYWITNAYSHGYNQYPVSSISTAFLPVQPCDGESQLVVATPSQCFANPKAAVLRFRILREDLQAHHTIFGVALNPDIDACAERLMMAPPANASSAQALFSYFAGRLEDIGVSGRLAERLGTALIVPVISDTRYGAKSPKVRFVAPRSCFIGDNATYSDIFDFVNFGEDANMFLLRVGSKHQPNATEIAGMLIRQPARLLDTFGADKYLKLLRKVAENAASLKKNRTLWQQLKNTPCLLAEKIVMPTATKDDEKAGDLDEDTVIKEYSLARASEMVIVDDFPAYRLFQSYLLNAPQEEILETLYSSLETPYLGQLVEDHNRKGALLRDQSRAGFLHKLILERCRLFLHDHSADAIRHDTKWMEQNLTVNAVEFLQVTHRLKGYQAQFVEKRTAALHFESKKTAILFVTAQYDLYEVSRTIVTLLLKRPKQQDPLALETILASDLRRLKDIGYNVDRILRQKAAESRVAESERQKREEEQKRLAEAEAAAQPKPQSEEFFDSHPETPDKQLAIPGSFSDSPDQITRPSLTDRGRKPKGLFSNIKDHLGLNTSSLAGEQAQNLLTNGQGDDMPPPYQAHDTNGGRALGPGTERVTSSAETQANLQSAIKALREFNGPTLFNPPQTKDIKETPSYCDSKPGHDLCLVAELQSGVKLYLSRVHPDPKGFLEANREPLTSFVAILSDAAAIFGIPRKTINIYHDERGASIAFNSNGSIFCNLRYFVQLHLAQMASRDGKLDAMAYWWITLCHELAHNLVHDHSSQHSYYTESFATHYFQRMLSWASRVE